MAGIPNINELREACGSDELSHVFTFLQSQDITEDEGFLIRMGDDSTQLRAKLDKRNDTIDEAFSFGPDNEVAKAGEDCLVESQGLGSPVFDKLEAELAKTALSIPATKGFEFGSGFAGISSSLEVYQHAYH
ncbi:chorismate synthase 1, chloroplastic [Artemisia annua]|uniref:chorismate synthase n=1 Tax=Artemisia annua TaxID=35608 RepID=A0A2U1NNT3_ARTAN|nr:chorismate synthase 1, chloroplastic [Artemisia annua]